MMPIAHLVELTYKVLGPYGMTVPQLTPSRVRLLSCSRTFDSTKAKDRLGYAPVVPLQVIQYLIWKREIFEAFIVLYILHACLDDPAGRYTEDDRLILSPNSWKSIQKRGPIQGF